MTKIQTGDKTVDELGNLRLTRSARGVLQATKVVPLIGVQTRLVTLKVPNKRSFLFAQNKTESGAGATVYVGGDGVTTANGYPLKPGERIALPVTPLVIALAISSSQDSSVRVIQFG